ncbi:MAG TPA: DUF1801 domain-containing protein [Symbiobacteriaceae bacterium]|nr:DUF1801 domain-containing protein [Symbiobacteriaceae bacterium]
MNAGLEAFVRDTGTQSEPVVRSLHRAISDAHPDIAAAVKWKQLTYALAGDYHHWICAIDVTKKAVSLRFHFGGLLDDPKDVFRAGSSKFLRTIDFASVDGLDPTLVTAYVRQAIAKLDYFKANWRELQNSR